MNALDTIYSRKSVRNFNGKNITENELKEILKSAYASPVGRAMYNTLHITVLSDRELIDMWEKSTADTFGNPDLHPFYGAPTVIIVSSDMSEPEMNNVNYSNAAIIVQNMALAATSLGIGACHIWGAVAALNRDKNLIKKMNIPESMTPCCAIALGAFDGKYEVRDIVDNRIATNYIR